MKLQIDTTNKTIKIDQNIKLSILIKNLKGMFPKGEWKNFTLETNTVIERWSSPIVIDRPYPVYPRPYIEPYTRPWYYMNAKSENTGLAVNSGKTNADYSLKSGVFNVELKA